MPATDTASEPAVTVYIPFDFGIWTSAEGQRCPRHGVQYGGPAITASPRPGETLTRRYCGLCLLDALDRAPLHSFSDEREDDPR